MASLLFAASAAAADIRLPEGPGADLVYAKCRTCHDLQYVVDAKGLLPAQWRAVVASMHDYGLTATKEEDEALVRYLAAYLGPNPPPSKPTKANAASKADGNALYAQNCATCHGAEGEGQPGVYPPLAKNPDLALDGGAFPVMVVLHGIEGPIDVAGAHYDSSMPSFGHLSDAEIALIVNHVEHAFGNAVNASPSITSDFVAKQRARSMTPAQVHAHRAGGAGKK
ncbi:MAG TPA: c-type cytochrome [Casimicrobiaceae bacterium]|nr:c-type cytochrome [Casimicrobiaceae bacterium]